MEWISRRWLGPVVRLSSEVDLEKLRDFVANRTFRHLWWNPDPDRIIRSVEHAESRGRSFESRPRMVHQIWIGEKEFPTRLAAYSETIRKGFPNWDHKIWREQDLAELAANAVMSDPILDESFPLGMRSDIIRLEVLRQYGGVYFDTDFEVIRDDVCRLYEDHQAFVYGDELSGRPANGMMAAPVGHPFLEFYLRRIAATLRKPADIFETVKLTGPEKLAESLNMWVGDWSSGEPFMIGGDTLGSFHAGGSILSLWKEVAYPYHYTEGSWATFDPSHFPKARVAHHWEGGWHREAV
ncbi:MAG: hypothetical protein EOP85_01820 [Verrucomicrobiaceae bacterium]|nr:MAG: hypothetical protein EOP85_01820 [Verrucomicrobiaceae bacterium]